MNYPKFIADDIPLF